MKVKPILIPAGKCENNMIIMKHEIWKDIPDGV